MSYSPLDDEARREREREDRKRAELRAKQFRKDVQDVFAQPAARRVLAGFLAAANSDGSAYRDSATAAFHAIGWHDAAGWWLDALRQHCPEREPQVRAEGRQEPRDNDSPEE